MEERYCSRCMKTYPDACRCPEHGVKVRAGPSKEKRDNVRYVSVSEEFLGEFI